MIKLPEHKLPAIVEVFKTNIEETCHAEAMRQLIRKTFSTYDVSFDLEDCDRILRVAAEQEQIDAGGIIRLLKNAGHLVEILPDLPPA